MHNYYASRFSEVLLAVKAQLLTLDFFAPNPNSVRIIADDETEIPLLTGGRDALVMPGSGTIQSQIADGSGRGQTPMRRTIEVAFRSRDNRDSVDNHELWAIQHLDHEHAIFDCFQMFDPPGPPIPLSVKPPNVTIAKTQAGDGSSAHATWSVVQQGNFVVGFWVPVLDGVWGYAAPILCNSTATDAQTAFNADFGGFTVTGSMGGPYTVTRVSDFLDHTLVVIQNQTNLLREPARLVSVSKASRRKRKKLTNGDAGIGVSVINLDVLHVLRLEQSKQ